MKKSTGQHLLPLANDLRSTDLHAASDEQLAILAQQDSREAFMTLYNRYLTKVYNRVKTRVPEVDVEDVTQEIFIAVMRSLDSFKGDSRFNTWVYTIVQRQIADYYRRRGKGGANDVVTVDIHAMSFNEPGYEHEHLDERAALQSAMNDVPDHYRDVVMMRFVDGLTFAEIADANGQSVEAVKSLYRRAIQAIKDIVGEDK
jgi:RNA polymerase sigma-70 factor (ECF subfamily)